MLEYGALCSAFEGCDGVFHTASPVPPTTVANPEASLYFTLTCSIELHGLGDSILGETRTSIPKSWWHFPVGPIQDNSQRK